jgi:hypothetical protein
MRTGLVHARVIAGVDNHVFPPQSACGETNGSLAELGEDEAVTCTECKDILALVRRKM